MACMLDFISWLGFAKDKGTQKHGIVYAPRSGHDTCKHNINVQATQSSNNTATTNNRTNREQGFPVRTTISTPRSWMVG